MTEPTGTPPAPEPLAPAKRPASVSLFLSFVLWLSSVEWVFEVHTFIIRDTHYPLSPLARFLVLTAAVVVGLPIAALAKKGWRYVLLVCTSVFWPLMFSFFTVATAVAFPLILPQQWAKTARAMGPPVRFWGSFVGKVVASVGVLLFSFLAAVTSNHTLLAVEVVTLLMLLIVYLAGFLHTAANPLMMVEVWQSTQLGTINMIRRIVGWLSTTLKSGIMLDFLIAMIAFMVVQRARSQKPARAWQHLCAFFGWLLVAICITVFAFAGVYSALLLLAPVSGLQLPAGFWARLSLSISVMGSIGVFDQLMYPFTILTVIVIVELLTSVYFIVVTVLAFTSMANESSSAMLVRVDKSWMRAIEAYLTELQSLLMPEVYGPRINTAIENIWKGLRIDEPPPLLRVEIHDGPPPKSEPAI
jgi:hypothetical protein